VQRPRIHDWTLVRKSAPHAAANLMHLFSTFVLCGTCLYSTDMHVILEQLIGTVQNG
jgi:hypothetical protein